MEQNRVMEFLGERDIWVLKTVVAQYIITGEPVGSRTVAKPRLALTANGPHTRRNAL